MNKLLSIFKKTLRIPPAKAILQHRIQLKGIQRTMLFDAPYNVILTLGIWDGINLSSLCRKTTLSYSYLVKMVNTMEEAGLVEAKLNGRSRKVWLTLKGKSVNSKFKRLMVMMQ